MHAYMENLGSGNNITELTWSEVILLTKLMITDTTRRCRYVHSFKRRGRRRINCLTVHAEDGVVCFVFAPATNEQAFYVTISLHDNTYMNTSTKKSFLFLNFL